MSFDRILVALDGSETAESILPHVLRLAAKASAELLLVKVEDPLPTDEGACPPEESRSFAEQYLRGVSDQVSKNGVTARILVRSGPVVLTLLRLAEEEHAAMIAMSTHGETASRSAPMGSVTESVLRSASVPVLAVRADRKNPYRWPPAPKSGGLSRIVVPIDGSKFSLGVIPTALEFARPFKARLILLHVLPSKKENSTSRRRPGVGRAKNKLPQEESFVKEWMKKQTEPFEHEGTRIDLAVKHGNPSRVITAVARARRAGLIAISTHGRGGHSNEAVGSVTEAVLRETPVPLLILRASESLELRAPGPSMAEEWQAAASFLPEGGRPVERRRGLTRHRPWR